MGLEEKYRALQETITGLGSAAVAFSGGVDSSLLCRVAHDVLGEKAIAVTISSPMMGQSETRAAQEFAAGLGMAHVMLSETSIDPRVAENPAHRCYCCKKMEFGSIIKAATERGISHVLDGSNMDDMTDYRPGLRALAELGVTSPLRIAGMGKAEVRELSRRLGLSTWDKPAMACLGSRIPYGERITVQKLGRIEQAEDYLHSLGLRQVRVRSHQDIARIEVAPEERVKLLDVAILDEVSVRLKSFGFLYVSMELAGYATGSMNRAIGRGGARNG